MTLPNNNRLIAMLGFAAAGTAAYARFVEPNWLEVRAVKLQLPRLPRAFNQYRIVHISDFHIGSPGALKRLLKAIEVIRQIEPDMIAITGDFVHRLGKHNWSDLPGILSQIEARDGVLAVMGNHDYANGVTLMREILQASQIHELSNTVYSLERDGTQLHLAGIDDAVYYRDSLETVLDQLPDTGAAILLAHEPDLADVSAATGRFDLQLSGHTHGGQIRLPLIGPPVLPSYGKRYAAGQYQIDRMILYTNRGLGTISPHVRFNARPEITVLTLECPA